MIRNNPLLCLLLLSALAVLLPALGVHGQVSTTTVATSQESLTVGWAAVKPVMDGVWAAGEWDDSNQVRISVYLHQVNDKGEAYLRLKHDNASLYGLVDVVSDNGSQPGGPKSPNNVVLSVDGNNDGSVNLLKDPLDYQVWIWADNKTSIDVLSIGSLKNDKSLIVASQKLGVSPNSNTVHRVYEFSIPLDPFIKGAPNGPDTGLPVVGLAMIVVDSFDNGLGLRQPPNLVQLKFGAIALPEGTESLVPVLLTITVLSLWKFGRTRSKT